MVRQTNRCSALVPFLAAVLIAVLLPATALAGHPGDHGGSVGSVPGGNWYGAGNGGGGGSTGSGDPDELGIYRMPSSLPGGGSAPVPSEPPRTQRRPDALSPKLRMVWAFLLGFRITGF
jgi:hypothetical protein